MTLHDCLFTVWLLCISLETLSSQLDYLDKQLLRHSAGKEGSDTCPPQSYGPIITDIARIRFYSGALGEYTRKLPFVVGFPTLLNGQPDHGSGRTSSMACISLMCFTNRPLLTATWGFRQR